MTSPFSNADRESASRKEENVGDRIAIKSLAIKTHFLEVAMIRQTLNG
jgi:hypothetical protein